ncbi:hypothetical protein HU200_015631 [Digitaria exilis]|uniref:F-box domain-containing protein n=1 Tax=Digitaria exilis TaxID=1010633 RepID=A0A835F8Q1_9POAL|nr:hypothetical protein HU200_015631 [Digitaria exilis]
MDALPPELQTTILYRLPARDVVRTSILSRPWRRRWESVPDLDIDLTDLHSWATATTFLSRCAAPIRRLRLHGVPPHLAVCVDSWLRLAAGKSPRVLSAPPVGFAGLRALATLSLEKVFFRARNAWRQVEEMLAAAPGLVELTLRDIIFHVAGDGGLPGRWVIGGQSLRRVELCLEIAGAGFWEVGSVPKLECAHVVLNDSPEHRDYFKLFTALSGVKELNVGNFNGRTYQVRVFLCLSALNQTSRIIRISGVT